MTLKKKEKKTVFSLALKKILKHFSFSKFEKKKVFSKSNSENSESVELNFNYYMIFDMCRTTPEEKMKKKKHFAT